MENYQPPELDDPEIPPEERDRIINLAMYLKDTTRLSEEKIAALRRIDPREYTHPVTQNYCRFLITISTGEPVQQR